MFESDLLALAAKRCLGTVTNRNQPHVCCLFLQVFVSFGHFIVLFVFYFDFWLFYFILFFFLLLFLREKENVRLGG